MASSCSSTDVCDRGLFRLELILRSMAKNEFGKKPILLLTWGGYASSSRTVFCRLPNVLNTHMFAYLDYRSLLRLAKTCTIMNQKTNVSEVWRQRLINDGLAYRHSNWHTRTISEVVAPQNSRLTLRPTSNVSLKAAFALLVQAGRSMDQSREHEEKLQREDAEARARFGQYPTITMTYEVTVLPSIAPGMPRSASTCSQLVARVLKRMFGD